ncbi:unnamed protein product [Lactuca saligna]|uniref:Uncharacterized protein n=1 Tax=Lactuca saligna TaxID=75948 RepID=A0AA35YDZ9_LACSI|nr:unnamed protein product [Lactuca saligna]
MISNQGTKNAENISINVTKAQELPVRCGQCVNPISCITSTSKTTPGTSDSQSLGNSMVYLLRWRKAVGGCLGGLLLLLSCLKLLVKTNGMTERVLVIKNNNNKGLGICSPVVAVKVGVVVVWWQQGGCHLFLPFSRQKQMRGRCEVVFGVIFLIRRGSLAGDPYNQQDPDLDEEPFKDSESSGTDTKPQVYNPGECSLRQDEAEPIPQ